ncbi:MAG: valine--tRNA ligase [Leptolyngbyaceae cyanobacterium MO_188.B28]|nr:valine--tRNA ligase [Leptolyngbyaceae cyanobacterium MO_188.B28]
MTATIPTLSSQYDPAATETKWQTYWEEKQVFKADPEQGGDPYCVVIPPPNVTGSLHMGHAFEMALIDTLVRYHRMKGRNTLWLPGTDHASIAVQTILEKELRSQGKSRYDVGREQFLNRAWEWKEESGGTIVGQLRKLGVSVDWTRERFTMDEGLSKAVLAAFTQLYEEGLIYRGEYMVNWCPSSQSAVSDVEVENKEVDGNLWHLRYPLTDESGFVEVATTRPETMLGDTAVAVNPNDDRYQHLIGKTVMLPIMNREIPIIADEYVDSSFGTGSVKITPAHDPNDFEMAQRHDLPMINIMNKDGSLNANAGPYEGLDRFEARKQVVARLEEEGRLVKVEDYHHTVPYSDRGKVPVEPLLSTQWFVKIRPLADKALDFLDNRQSPQFVPERWTKVYRDWLVNLKDWCISRQLWWGHQIPAWYAVSETGGEITDHTPFVVALNEADARSKAEERFGPEVQLVQDPDVLDTWFSSGLWPFSTMGWPDQSVTDFNRYYPTTTLVTGFDIIFFWVARMTMMAGHFTDVMPFETVYIHGLVRDENNKKMSKSANNGIDPKILINKYGSDALRYTLIREVAGAGQDIRLEYNRKTDESASVEASRNFTNKLWNASRFVMMNLGGKTPTELGDPDNDKLELSDRWILSRFYQVVRTTSNYVDNYGLGEAAKELYEFIWGDFCDWYIELVKSRLQSDGDSKLAAQQTLAYVLDGILKLLHPFMPHITEEVWRTLTQSGDDQCLALQPYPTANLKLIAPELEKQFDLLIGTIRTIRNLRAEAGVKPSVKIEAILQSDSAEERGILTATQTYIQDLARVESLTINDGKEEAQQDKASAQSPETTVATTAVERDATKPPSESLMTPAVKDALANTGSSLRAFLENPVEFLNGIFGDVRNPAFALGLLVGVVIIFYLVAVLFHALNEIPILPGALKLIGFGCTIWFSIKYLPKEERRQALFADFQSFWRAFVGPRIPRPTAQPLNLTKAQKIIASPVTDDETPVINTAPAVPPEPVETPQNDISQSQMFAGVVGTVQVLIPLTGVVDVEALKAKLKKDLGKVDGEIKSLSGRLGNASFVEKAPAEVVQGAQAALAEAEKQAEMLRHRLSLL